MAISFVSGQTKSDFQLDIRAFAGKWALVSTEGTRRNSIPNFENYSLGISISGNEFKVQRNFSYSGRNFERTELYFTDNRGEVNKVPKDRSKGFYETKTKTIWKNGQIISRWSYKVTEGWIDVTNIYRLSPDGKSLICESIYKGAYPQETFRLIFQRVI